MRVVMEMSGRVMREVYTEGDGEDVVVIDWDDIKEVDKY